MDEVKTAAPEGYALMRLAAEFGVDYGDVLLWADDRFYEWCTFHTPSLARCVEAALARERITMVTGQERADDLARRIHAWAKQRATWCKPPLGSQVYA